MNIRPFDFNSDKDYAEFTHLGNVIFPDHPTTVAERKRQDREREARYKFGRFVHTHNNQIVGTATYNQWPWEYHPHRFWVASFVLPEYRGRGIGTALFDYVLDQIVPFEPHVLTSDTRLDQPDAMRFLEKRGFKIVQRNPVSHLDVASFDPAPFTKWEQKFIAAGLTLKTLTQLQAEYPDTYQHLVYELETELEQDVPSPYERVKRPFDEYAKIFSDPNLLPDGMIFACDGEQLVGMTELFRTEADPTMLHQGMTGTVRSHRRKGIAVTLKLHGLQFAQQFGAKTIRTDNEENNPMFGINEMLGFGVVSADLGYKKLLKTT